MHHLLSCFRAFLLCFVCNFAAAIHSPTRRDGHVSINCGGSGFSTARDGLEWSGDVNPKFPPLLQIKGSSIASGIKWGLISGGYPVPYGTARISNSRFSYEFQLSPGEKIVRLHFNSATYNRFRRLSDLFAVESGPFTLLSNFSASVTADTLGVNYFVKEFCINVEENQLLSLIFSPSSSQLLDTYAFVNGIEIISVPSSHSYFHVENVGVQMVGKSRFYVGKSSAFEIMSRLQFRRDSVLPIVNNFSNMFGMWERTPVRNVDKIRETDVTPRTGLNNIAWRVYVDVGFSYMIRLYFSNLGFERAETVEFKIRLNEMTGIVTQWMDGKQSNSWFRDFMVLMNGGKHEGRRDILIYLETCEGFMDRHGPLQGFEVMKLSNPDNSLAAPNPMPSAQNSSYQTVKNLLRLLGQKEVLTFFAVAVISLINIIIYILQQTWEDGSVEKESTPLAREEWLYGRFSLAEIQLTTRNFSDTHFLGRGGLGKVHRGFIDNRQQTMPIKRLESKSRQEACEFLTRKEWLCRRFPLAEIQLATRNFSDAHFIGRGGFGKVYKGLIDNGQRTVAVKRLESKSSEHGEMVLVYEYMARGTLADHLYKLKHDDENHSYLTWKKRLNICIGAGRGLDYLHTGCSLIHHDVKSSNILLDEKLFPKVSDFGLAKYLSINNLQRNGSTKVRGTFGYIDPNYINTGRLTTKNDVYAFGVVLLEVLSGRPAVDSTAPVGEQVLITWAQDHIRQGKIEQIVASNLRGEISGESLKVFVRVAESCLNGDEKKRPPMAKVVLQLELALQQQKPSEFPFTIDDTSSGFKQVTTLSTNFQKANLPLKQRTYSKGVNPVASLQMPVTPYKRWRFWSRKKVSKRQQQSEAFICRKGVNFVGGLTYKRWRFWSRKKVSKRQQQSEAFICRECGNFVGELTYKHWRFWSRKKVSKRQQQSEAFICRKCVNFVGELTSFEMIGKGRTAEVYKAVAPDGSKFAIKKMTQSPSSEVGDIRSQIVKTCLIRHRNILRLLLHRVQHDCHYLFYKYMKNGNLQDYLQHVAEGRRELDWLARHKIALGVAAALEHLHQNHCVRIFHRDLKPANILLDEEMVVRITGLEVAVSVPGAHTHATTSHVVGAMGYVAPEYYKTLKFSDKCDVYSFGMILDVLVTGKRPTDEFFGNTVGLNMVQWMRYAVSSEDPERAIDPDLLGDGYEEQIVKVLKVACLCTLDDPMERPNSRQVSVILSRIA